MDMTTPKFGPSDIEHFASVLPSTLRGYHHRKLIGFGVKQENGRRLYSGHEVLALAIGHHLAASGTDLRYAFWIGWEMGMSVIYHVTGRNENYDRGISAFWAKDAGSPEIQTIGFDLQWKSLRSYEDLQTIGATVITVVDPAQLATIMPQPFIDYMRGED